ncbi:TPA: hypothetical protein DCZ36_03605 [Candidatus Gracilibacteria bacterium]|nr:hypothetical protein [Candidatus Gracilibacteria bacterium]
MTFILKFSYIFQEIYRNENTTQSVKSVAFQLILEKFIKREMNNKEVLLDYREIYQNASFYLHILCIGMIKVDAEILI